MAFEMINNRDSIDKIIANCIDNQGCNLVKYCESFSKELTKRLKEKKYYNELTQTEQKSFTSKLQKAIIFAANRHIKKKDGKFIPQYREGGSFYISHPLEIVDYLIETLDKRHKVYPGLDQQSLIIASILHDVMEDGLDFNNQRVQKDEIEKLFGKNAATFVDGVTKEDKPSEETLEQRNERRYRDLQKIFKMAAISPEIIFIKMADSRHNLSHMKDIKDENRRFRNASDAYEYGLISDFIAISGDDSFRLNIDRIRKVFDDSTEVVNPELKEHYKKIFDEDLITTDVHKGLVGTAKDDKQATALKKLLLNLSKQENCENMVNELQRIVSPQKINRTTDGSNPVALDKLAKI